VTTRKAFTGGDNRKGDDIVKLARVGVTKKENSEKFPIRSDGFSFFLGKVAGSGKKVKFGPSGRLFGQG
jgi:hypothetical protein